MYGINYQQSVYMLVVLIYFRIELTTILFYVRHVTQRIRAGYN